MANNKFAKWNQNMDVEGMRKDLSEIKDNQQEYKEVPHDVYEVSVNKLFLDESKNSGLPMLKVWFKIVEGEYKGQLIFMNQMLISKDGGLFGLHTANNFLRSMKTDCPVAWVDWVQYDELLDNIKDELKDRKMTFQLNYGKAKKGDWHTYTIEDVFYNED